jgi:pyruvate dehydrogenase E2 component (dihydrolipoamide acetyltransferase)/2-oxoisovalerate dehydrogenase E2 component (dihydrolipoyl transacylase)
MGKTVTIKLPDIGEGVVEGEVIEWLKQVGDSLKQDEPVVVVMTDKATVELPAPYPGRLAKQYHKPGEMAHRDQPIYDIEVADVQKTETETQAPAKTQESKPKIELPSAAVPKQVPSSTTGAQATPPVRQLAKELGMDINAITGTGKDGRVTEHDVVKFHAKTTAKSSSSSTRAAPEITTSTPVLHMEDDEEQPLTGMRNIVAEKMVESKYIVPHYSFFDTLDATRLVQLRTNIKREAVKQGINVSYMPFFIKALSEALKKYPAVNGSVDLETNKLIIHKHHNIGIATKTPLGLMVFVLKNVQSLKLVEIIRMYDAMKKKATENKLDRGDLLDSTITISNFGTLGGQWATPIINYPEIAILGIARIQKQPVVVQDEVVIRERLNLSWSFDHRVIDGDGAAEFSNYFIHLIENPAQLLN